MKSILISIKPKYVVDILNGRKIIEIRKTCPKCELPIDVYIYCTKDNVETLFKSRERLGKEYYDYACLSKKGKDYNLFLNDINLNGKVVAKFRLNKVEEQTQDFYKGDDEHFLKHCRLTTCELFDYIGHSNWYIWHIDNLKIFDEPKEISEFKRCTEKTCIYGKCHKYMHCLKPLTKAPQSWCYVEVDE